MKHLKQSPSVNNHEIERIQCTEMGNADMSPEQCIEAEEFVDGFKVITTRPILSDEEYVAREQGIVENIVDCLSSEGHINAGQAQSLISRTDKNYSSESEVQS